MATTASADRNYSSGELTLGPGILSALGEQHKRQRKLLVPVFSIAHLRNMAPIFYGVAHKVRLFLLQQRHSAEYRRPLPQVRDAIKSRVQPDGSILEMDMNDWMGRTTLEMLGQAALGYSFDNFFEDSTDAFGESLKAFLYARLFSRLGTLHSICFAVARHTVELQ